MLAVHGFGAAGVHGDGVGEHGLRPLFNAERKIEDWIVDMEVHFGVRALQLEAGFLRGQRIQHGDALAALRVHRKIARDQFHQLRRALKGIEDEYAIFIGQLETLRHQRHARALLVALLGFLLVEFLCLFHRGRSIFFDQVGVFLFPLVRSIPVHEIRGQLLPFAALLREITHAVADDLVIADQLVVTVFEDEPVVSPHAGSARLQGNGL